MKLTLRKPGRMRWDYQQPPGKLFVSDGKTVYLTGSTSLYRLHSVIQWRLLFPLIGQVLSLPPPVVLGLAGLGCVFVLAFVVTVLRRRGVGWGDSGLIAMMLGATSWFFTSTGWLGSTRLI